MPSISVQRNLPRDDEGASSRGALTRCPHCERHFYAGGEATGDEVNVNDDGEVDGGYDQEREKLDEGMRKVDAYSNRKGFAGGGEVAARAQRRFDKGAESNDDETFTAHLAKRSSARARMGRGR